MKQNTEEYIDKYNRMGCYSISIAGKLVYIGKSKNMKRRIQEHIRIMKNPNTYASHYKNGFHKYFLFNEALSRNLQIQFDTLCYCNNEDDLNKSEAALINKYLPPLNYLIPGLNGEEPSRNEKEEEITLDDILALDSIKLESAYCLVS